MYNISVTRKLPIISKKVSKILVSSEKWVLSCDYAYCTLQSALQKCRNTTYSNSYSLLLFVRKYDEYLF